MGKASASFPGHSWEMWPGNVARKALEMGLHVTTLEELEAIGRYDSMAEVKGCHNLMCPYTV